MALRLKIIHSNRKHVPFLDKWKHFLEAGQHVDLIFAIGGDSVGDFSQHAATDIDDSHQHANEILYNMFSLA